MKPIKLVAFLFLLTPFNAGAQHQDNEIDYPKFDQYFHDSKFSGNVLVAVHGKPIFRKSYGYANLELNVSNTLETKFRIGSITKQFTAMAIMILQVQGKLSVRDEMGDHLSDIPEEWKGITIHQLLTHTSGLMHSWALKGFRKTMMLHNSIQQTIDRFKGQPLVGKPGEKFAYSGVGYFVLSDIIQKVSGKSYEAFLKEEVFDKIGMKNTGCDNPLKLIQNKASGYITNSSGVSNAGYIYIPILTGGGNLYSTVDDLLKWDQSFYGNKLVSKETKKMIFMPELKNYGYGWIILETEKVYRMYHSGGVPGFGAFIDRYPNKGVVIIIMSNNIQAIAKKRVSFPKLVLKELAE